MISHEIGIPLLAIAVIELPISAQSGSTELARSRLARNRIVYSVTEWNMAAATSTAPSEPFDHDRKSETCRRMSTDLPQFSPLITFRHPKFLQIGWSLAFLLSSVA